MLRTLIFVPGLLALLLFSVRSTDAFQALDERALNLADQQISAYIREVFQDCEGHYWFGTNGDGVARYDGASLAYFGAEQGFAGAAVRGIAQDSAGSLWFVTDAGVTRYTDGAFTNYTDAHGLRDTDGWSIFIDSTDTVWIGTVQGVARFDGTRFVPFDIPRATVENPQPRFTPTLVWAIHEDPEGHLWFSTDGEGLRKYDGQSFTTFTTADGLAGNNIRSIYRDRRGDTWFGSTTGLTRYDAAAFHTYTADDGVPDGWVWTFAEDGAGDLWIAVLGTGLVRYDGESFTTFTHTSGLSRSHVQSIYLDDGNRLWLGCSGGLYRFDNGALINITKDGPWPVMSGAADHPLGAFERMVDGEWRLGSESGWSMFDRWQWGPGKRSIISQTYGTDNEGDPWRVLRVYYHEPQQGHIALLGMHRDIPGIGRGLSEGTISFDGDTAEGVFDLHQSVSPTGNAVHRKMALKWSFTANEHYIDTLLEESGRGFDTLAEWKRVRSDDLTPLPAVTEADAKPSGPFDAFTPLVGRDWHSTIESPSGESLRIRTDVEWIPYVQAIRARISTQAEGKEPTAILEAFLYRHPAAGTLHALVLSSDGTVYKGSLSVENSGELHFDLTSSSGSQLLARINPNGDTARTRIWSTPNTERTLLLDVHHHKQD